MWEQGSSGWPGGPRGLGADSMFSVSVSQSQGGEVIAEQALPADTGCIGTLGGIWAVGEGSCLSEPHGRLPGRGGPELTAQMGCSEPQRSVGLWALVLGWGRAEAGQDTAMDPARASVTVTNLQADQHPSLSGRASCV